MTLDIQQNTLKYKYKRKVHFVTNKQKKLTC